MRRWRCRLRSHCGCRRWGDSRALRCGMRSRSMSCGSGVRRRTRDHGAGRRLARDSGRGRRRSSHDVGSLTGLGHDLPWALWSNWLRGCARGSGCYVRQIRLRRGRSGCVRRGRNHHGWTSGHRRRGLCRCLGLLAFEDCLQGIAGLGDLGQVELRPVVGRWPRRTYAARSAGEVTADLLRLVDFDRAGVRLLFGDANRRERVQNGLALYFQFACQIVDSNFAHPSLFSLP